MIKRILGNSFKREILVCFILLALVPLLISNGTLVKVFQRSVQREEESHVKKQLYVIEETLIEKIEEFEQIAEQLCNKKQIIQNLGNADRWVQNSIYTILYEETTGLREYASFEIINADGTILFTTKSNAVSENWPVYWGIIKIARTHPDQFIIRSNVGCHKDNDSILQGAKAIINEKDECVGYILIEVEEKDFEYLLLNVYDSDIEITLMDSFWEEIYCSKNARSSRLSEWLREERMKERPVPVEISRGGMCYYVQEIGSYGLFLGVAKQTVLTETILGKMITIISVMTGISLALCFIIAEFISNNLSAPIRKLSNAMKSVESGNLDIRIDSTRDDELGQLTNNFNKMTMELKEYMELQIRQQKELDDANIAMMQAQLNPHFLYNTLDTMKWIAKANHVTEIATLSSDLAKILRTSISAERFIPLRQEIELVESYVEIQRVRFHDSFEFDVEMPIELEDLLIPKLIIQPIVENAIIHGLSEHEAGYIFVNIFEKENKLLIEVSDDGKGMSEEMLSILNERNADQLKGHLGFGNVDTILRLYYGEEYGLQAKREPYGGTKVIMTLPIE